MPVLYTVYTNALSACFIHGLYECLECLFYTRFIRALRVPVLYTVYTSVSSVCFIHGLYERFECLFYIRFMRALRVPRETHKVRIDKIQVQNPYRK